jgi:uncharacterized SAM-binding protein YcdF (DUF218 family)
MFVFLSKFLPNFIYPVGLTFLLLVLALIARNKKKLRNGLIIFALVLVYLSGNRWVAVSLARSLEWRYFPPAEFTDTRVAVLLSGGTESMQYPRTMVEVNSAGDRVLYAAHLYNQGKIDTILLTGGYIPWAGSDRLSPADEMKEILMLMGVPESAMWIEPDSLNTYENALFSAEILRENDIDTVLLITSAMHMPRSVPLFEAQGITVIPAPADYTVTREGWESLWNGSFESVLTGLIPSSGNISLTTNVMKEYIGMAVYSLQGWMD